jgi:arylsulfatase A-like enzyme/Flp pilus assembly protein TadD
MKTEVEGGRLWRGVPLAAVAVIGGVASVVACSSAPAPATPAPRPSAARSVVLVTIDTLRADHVGAYGYAPARTPAIDGLARQGVRFDHAYAAAPITLPSHASILTGRYPPGHGSRHNLIAIDPGVPTLATILHDQGFATAAFVAAFPLDHRFGLARGFDVYSDRMPRDATGRPLNRRPGRSVIDEALAWLAGHRGTRFFLWVHLFEPHAPYGDPRKTRGRSTVERYDDEIATADEEVGRLLQAVRAGAPDSAIVLAADHGEGLGEHGEPTHSLFVYDTTLRVPLVVAGPSVPPAGIVSDPVCLIDVAPTVLKMLGVPRADTDGIDLSPAFTGGRLSVREIYAESFAPFFDFGWSPLRSLRSSGWKYIAAPRPELYRVDEDPAEARDRAASEPLSAAALRDHVERYSPADLPRESRTLDKGAASRLRALGYVSSGGAEAPAAMRPDPKDRRELAARFAQIASGELTDQALRQALEAILHDDPRNPQANLRLGWALLDTGDTRLAEPRFAAAVAARMPSADPYLGLAACQTARGDLYGALATLAAVGSTDRENPVVLANVGVLETQLNHLDRAIAALARAVALDPEFSEARFDLSRAYARAGRFAEAERECTELLKQLPADAPQRPEVQRLIVAIRDARSR